MTTLTGADNKGRPGLFVGSELGDDDFALLRELLLERSGIDLAMYKDRCIKRRIATRIRSCGFSAAAPYLQRLRDDDRELGALLAALSIHVSQFFRNPTTFAALRERFLPQLVANARLRGRHSLTLWSAGCAGGEEAYSLALLMDGLVPAGMRLAVLGSDVSAAVLERARAALFDDGRLSEVPAEIRERSFVREERGYRLQEPWRSQVRFERHDLLGEAPYPAADLILCRNVLIYFSRAEQEKIVRRFAAALVPGGYLVLGKTETLLGETRALFSTVCPVERVYRREDESAAPSRI